MPTSAAGSSRRAARRGGFTLLELLVVVSIIAFATAGVSFAMRDSSQTQLEREAVRLAALLESARAQSRSTGVPVRWRPTGDGFHFDGLPDDALPHAWLAPGISAGGAAVLLLGPDPIIGAQSITLSAGEPLRTVRVETDGLRPFVVQSGDAP